MRLSKFVFNATQNCSIRYISSRSNAALKPQIVSHNSVELIEANTTKQRVPLRETELDDIIKRSSKSEDLMEILTTNSHNLKPDNLKKIIHKLALFNCYDKETNKYTIKKIQLPENINAILIRLLIKNLPHFDNESIISALNKFVILGYTSNDACVRALLQIVKYHINGLDLVQILNLNKSLNKLADQSNMSPQIESLKKALGMVVETKYLEIYSVSMAKKLLNRFPAAFVNGNLEKLLNNFLANLGVLNKKQQYELIDLILDSKSLSLEIFEKTVTTLRSYINDKRHCLIENTLEGNLELLKRLVYLNDSLIETNYYAREMIEDLFDLEIDILKNLNISESNQLWVDCFNSILNYCLKVRFYKSEILDFVFQSESNAQILFTNELVQVDKLFYYAGLCNYDKYIYKLK